VIDLGRRDGRVLRIGHRGAAALAPENTLESLRLAIELGCDLVEFDVRQVPGGRLVLAHDRPRGSFEELPGLDEALAFLGTTDAGAHLDLKTRGAEAAVVDALRRHGLVERTVVSSLWPPTLRAIAALEPALRLGITYPRDRTRLGDRHVAAPLVGGVLAALRRRLATRIEGILARAGATAAVLHWQVLDAAVVERCHTAGAAVLAWTVDDRGRLRQLDELGVDGVVTNDPRIFEG
jgi:glycerophosphoryl diester phosphodiesterase